MLEPNSFFCFSHQKSFYLSFHKSKSMTLICDLLHLSLRFVFQIEVHTNSEDLSTGDSIRVCRVNVYCKIKKSPESTQK